MKYGKQQTFTWHVDDLKSIHVYPKVNEEFTQWCENTYGSDDLVNVIVARGKIHDYLGMIMDFTQEGSLKIDMICYIVGILEEFPYDINATQKTPWMENLLKIQ